MDLAASAPLSLTVSCSLICAPRQQKLTHLRSRNCLHYLSLYLNYPIISLSLACWMKNARSSSRLILLSAARRSPLGLVEEKYHYLCSRLSRPILVLLSFPSSLSPSHSALPLPRDPSQKPCERLCRCRRRTRSSSMRPDISGRIQSEDSAHLKRGAARLLMQTHTGLHWPDQPETSLSMKCACFEGDNNKRSRISAQLTGCMNRHFLAQFRPTTSCLSLSH